MYDRNCNHTKKNKLINNNKKEHHSGRHSTFKLLFSDGTSLIFLRDLITNYYNIQAAFSLCLTFFQNKNNTHWISHFLSPRCFSNTNTQSCQWNACSRTHTGWYLFGHAIVALLKLYMTSQSHSSTSTSVLSYP